MHFGDNTRQKAKGIRLVLIVLCAAVLLTAVVCGVLAFLTSRRANGGECVYSSHGRYGDN